jgi:hypothetical protein
MPVDFQSIQAQIREMGQKAEMRERDLLERLRKAREVLYTYAVELESVQQRVAQAATANKGLRCAVPFGEPLTTQLPAPPLECDYVLLAADGSQVVPSHHDAVEFGVINVGAIRFLPGQPYAPREYISSRLLSHESLYNHDGYLLTEEVIALMRDVEERGVLADLARQEKMPVVTLTDGQLEIYGQSKQSKEFDREIERYKNVLNDLAALHVITAGYVSKPRSDLTIRMLDLFLVERLDQVGNERMRPLSGLTDSLLFGGFRDIPALLGPGERSAVFAIHSKANTPFDGALAVHFFYLNVSQTNTPVLARVEIPAWVAADSALVDLLHYSLVGQCRHLGSQPYPYALHRAHEVAVVSLDEKKQLENMIIIELRRQGAQVSAGSEKQFHKEAPHRTRYP